ncbi:MAG: alkylmercury lyase family protein [Candidatus Rokubacteria bacterium]|nr:alkylmercury lyase family protein [Candidatus Rokubacteria bacterium]
MGGTFEVKRAEDLLDAEFIAKWRDRKSIDPLAREVLRTILDRFVENGGPLETEAVTRHLPGRSPGEIQEAIARLDQKDLILVQDGKVVLAYPFSAAPTAFRVMLGDGRGRYAVCAIDALGVSPMLGQLVRICSSCHHCGEPLEMVVRPDGPVERASIMVWVGERGDIRQKACSSICLTLNFFQSQEHLRQWRKNHPEVSGAAASLDEAFKLGARIFGELLGEII